MAPFRLGHDELQHELPWLLMQNGPVTKYWGRDGFIEDLAEMQSRGFRVERFDASAWDDEDAMFSEFRQRLGFPDYFWMNFDALADSLNDLDVPADTGLVLALENFVQSRTTETLLEVLGGASRWWLLFGRLLIVLLRTDDAEYEGPEALGGMPAQWNRREWSNDRRR